MSRIFEDAHVESTRIGRVAIVEMGMSRRNLLDDLVIVLLIMGGRESKGTMKSGQLW